VVAGLIDLALSAVVGGLVLAILFWVRASNGLSSADLAAQLLNASVGSLAATVFLAGFEASPLEASPGKLARGLRVRHFPGAERLSLARALIRNLFKLGLPLPLAYLAGLAAYDGGGVEAWVGIGAAVVVALSYLAGAFFGDGRAVYDQVAGAVVIRTQPGRRFA